MRRILVDTASGCLTILMLSALLAAQAQTPTEYQLKAAFIYNFARFVEWPSLTGADASPPMVIGILGEDPFGRDIDDAIEGKAANGRRLVVKRFSSLKQFTPCSILFVSASQGNNLKQIFAAAAGAGALTVGETDGFAEAGGVIHYTMREGRIRLIINRAAAERAGLRISAKLLSLAKVIRK
jgi:YfiR/HmsC-like